MTIKSWSEEDRPREKLLAKGREALSNAELIAILIGSGTKNKTAVDVARELLSSAGEDLDDLGKFSIKRLSQTNGIGPAKAISIIAALELGKRRREGETRKTPEKITSSKDIYNYMYRHLAHLDHERFYVLLLNQNHRVMRHFEISKGGVAGTFVDSKLIYKAALEELAPAIILCHNHPSGSKEPSQADKELTKNIVNAGKFFDIRVLDHLIFTDTGYLSFADEGLI